MKHLESSHKAYFSLIIFWLLLTGVLVTATLYFNWHQEELKSQQMVFLTSEEVSNNLDSLINQVKNAVYAIPALNEPMHECTSELKQGLLHAVFNNPFISAISIKDKHNTLICSTLSEDILFHSNNGTEGLSGPVNISDKDESAYILEQHLGQYTIEVYLLKSLLERTLQATKPFAAVIALYDSVKDKVILQIHHNNELNLWQSSLKSDYTAIKQEKPANQFKHRTTLSNIKNIEIILIPNQTKLSQLVQWNRLISFLFIILLSLLMLFYIRRIIRKRFSLHHAIINAVKNDRFFPVYQPIYDMEKNQYTGAEVLMRWETENNEVINPDVFVDEAEKSGLIVPITLQIVEKALSQCQSILADNTAFHLGFNLSSAHFTHPDFFRQFDELCFKYHIKPKQILLEITERELISHNDTPIMEKMKELRLAGHALAIDDFGTGHASINYLRHFPFNYLKIDRLFISAIGTGAITEALNHSIIQLAKNLKLGLIAEGVETKVQLDYLKNNDVQLVQGWYFAKAMPIIELIPFLQGEDNE